MALAELADINAYLPADKIVLTGPQGDIANLKAERVIKAYLAGIYTPATLAGWSSPATTPQVVQDIAAKLGAAFSYREFLSEDIPDIDRYSYPMVLYNEAMSMIKDIRDGTIVLAEVSAENTNSVIEFTNLDFLPNDATTPGVQFTLEMEF